MNSETSTEISEKTAVLEHIFDAPRELVFAAFSTSEHLQKWYGPKEWTLPVSKMDFRVGGRWHYCMRSPKGKEKWGIALYHEIVPPEKIVYTEHFTDQAGTISENGPRIEITLLFEAVAEKTKVTNRATFKGMPGLEKATDSAMNQGFKQAWGKLDLYLTDLKET